MTLGLSRATDDELVFLFIYATFIVALFLASVLAVKVAKGIRRLVDWWDARRAARAGVDVRLRAAARAYRDD